MPLALHHLLPFFSQFSLFTLSPFRRLLTCGMPKPYYTPTSSYWKGGRARVIWMTSEMLSIHLPASYSIADELKW